MEEKKKERFELLLEEIKGDIKGVAEGHHVIRREMQEMKTGLMSEIDLVKGALRIVAKDVSEMKVTLDEHVKLPAHA